MNGYVMKKRGLLFLIVVCIFLVFLLISGCSADDLPSKLPDEDKPQTNEINFESGVWTAKVGTTLFAMIFSKGKGSSYYFEDDIFVEVKKDIFTYSIAASGETLIDGVLPIVENNLLILTVNENKYSLENNTLAKIIPLRCFIRENGEINTYESFCYYDSDKIVTKGIMEGDKTYSNLLLSSTKSEINGDVSLVQMYAFSDIIKEVAVTIEGTNDDVVFKVNSFMSIEEINELIEIVDGSVIWTYDNKELYNTAEIVDEIFKNSFVSDILFKVYNTVPKMEEPIHKGIWLSGNDEKMSAIFFNALGFGTIVNYNSNNYISNSKNVLKVEYIEERGYFVNDSPVKHINDIIYVTINGIEVPFKRNLDSSIIPAKAYLDSTNLNTSCEVYILYDGNIILTKGIVEKEITYNELMFAANREGTNFNIDYEQMFCFNAINYIDVEFLVNSHKIKTISVNNYMTEDIFSSVVNIPTMEGANSGFWFSINDEFGKRAAYIDIVSKKFSENVIVEWRLNAAREELPLKNGYWIAEGSDYIYLIKFDENESAQIYDCKSFAYKGLINNLFSVTYSKVVGYAANYDGFSLANAIMTIKFDGKNLKFKRNLSSVKFTPLEIIYTDASGELLSSSSQVLFLNQELKTPNFWLNGALIIGSEYFSDRDAIERDLNAEKLFAFQNDVVNSELKFLNEQVLVSKYLINNYTTSNWFVNSVKIPRGGLYQEGNWMLGSMPITEEEQLYNKIYSSEFHPEFNVAWKKNIVSMDKPCNVGVWTGVLSDDKMYVIKFDSIGKGLLYTYINEYYSDSSIVECVYKENEGYFNGEANLDYNNDTLTYEISGNEIVFVRNEQSALKEVEYFAKILDGENVRIESFVMFAFFSSDNIPITRGVVLNGNDLGLNYYSNLMASEKNYSQENLYGYPTDLEHCKISFIFEDVVKSSFDVHNYFKESEFKKIVKMPDLGDIAGAWCIDGNAVVDGGYNALINSIANSLDITFVKPLPLMVAEFIHENRTDKVKYYFKFLNDGFAHYGYKDEEGVFIVVQIFEYSVNESVTYITCISDGDKKEYTITIDIASTAESFKMARPTDDDFLKKLFKYTLTDPIFSRLV